MTATQAETFRVERSIMVNAPAERIFPLINDFREWAKWSPYEKLDPVLTKEYSGAAHGVGAEYAWSGRKAGTGNMLITRSEPGTRILIDLHFTRPMKADNEAQFLLEREGAATRITWAMEGKRTLMTRVMGIFISMDRLIGKDFETGLANIRNLAEQGP